MKNVISASISAVKDTIHIPSSKSISNRMLIIRALAGSRSTLHNLSASDDTEVLRKAIETESDVKDVGHAGTSMRFLAAYLSIRPGEFVLTGSERMKQRPIGPLTDALKQIEARIDFLGRVGYPPLKITGGGLKGGSIEIEAGISSQFISALMMIGPVLEGGLSIHLKGQVVSSAYIRMTLALMNRCGVNATFDGRCIRVPRGSYSVPDFVVESDWSGASYWYEVAALLPGSEITLPNLSTDSLQGDSALIQIFQPLGVRTLVQDGGIRLESQKQDLPESYSYDFTSCPDLVQTLAVSLCALGIPFRFTGTRTLRIKETDRIAALQNELRRVGFVLAADPQGEWLEWDGRRCEPESGPAIRTYHDHRMAMAFAPMALTLGSISIEDPGVVSKSYPDYWADLVKAGFEIRAQE